MVHVCMMRQILLMHVYAMHTSVILCDAYIYVPQSLTMMHVCMMHISMILDLDPETCVYVACVYDAANFVPDERTNGRTDKAILGV